VINWNLLQPVDIGGQFQQGLERGRLMARQRAVEGALSRYPTVITESPNEQDVRLLAMYAPEQLAAVDGIRKRRYEIEETARIAQNRRAIGSVYASGNTEGAINQAVAGGDFDLAKTFQELGKPQQKLVEGRVKAAAPHAYQALQLPDDAARVAYFQQPEVQRQLLANGWSADELAAYKGDPGTLNQIIAGASTVEQLRERDKVTWRSEGGFGEYAVDSMGRPVGSGNPYAGALGGPSSSDPPAPPSSAPSGGGGALGGLTIERNNNPGALRKPGSTEFQSFRTPQEGIQAQEALLGRYHKRGLQSVSSVVETYAPRQSRGGDNTDAQVNNYVSYVSDRLGIDPNAPIPANQIPRLAEAMREFETGNRRPPRNRMADAGPRRVSSKAEFDKLPSGTPFIAPDGSRRIKP
jgi:hypothetical protein